MEIKSMSVIGSLNTPLDIQSLSHIGSQYYYTPGHGYLKIENKITACIYNSGKIQIYGIKDIDKIQCYWNIILEKLNNYVDISKADPIPILKFMVVSEKLPYRVNLQILSLSLPPETVEYEPEQFPQLIWKLTHCTCLLFSTGSCVFAGVNTVEKIYSSINEVKTKIELIPGAISL